MKAVIAILMFFLSSQVVSANTVGEVLSWEGADSVGSWGEDLSSESTQLQGKFKNHKTWKSFLCRRSYWDYHAALSAHLASVDFELNEDGTIDVYADLYDLEADLEGWLRSGRTLCIPMGGYFDPSIDRAEVFAKVSFTGNGQDLKDLKVKIIATRLGMIHFGGWVPGWMERWITHSLNRTLARIWASKLGDWLSGKLSDIIKDKIPLPGDDR